MKPTVAITLITLLTGSNAFARNDKSATAETPQPAAETTKPAATAKAEKPKPAAKAPAPEAAAAPKPATKPVSSGQKMREEQEKLALENALASERLSRELSELRASTERIKAEREALTEQMALETALRQSRQQAEIARFTEEKERLERETLLAKSRAEKSTSDLKALQAEASIATTKLDQQIKEIEAKQQRRFYADSDPSYLEEPLRKDGILVISDRRISLNGTITEKTADHVATRIHYFNNQDPKKPIFIVIDDSPGGSVMSGYRILRAMEASEAPIHVVVKTFAASMAATIATLAEHSYAFPNSLILHHQIANRFIMTQLNLTEQKEQVERANQFWLRLAGPVAKKMGITLDEFIKRMYEEDSNGDWIAFADEAKQLKWINHVINGVEETSLLTSPDKKATTTTTTVKKAYVGDLEPGTDAEGRPVMFIPRGNPLDVYYLYDPHGYYQMR
jgi:ATP-dependent Clp protease protease subunit